MNNEVEKILYERAKLVQNLDRIITSYKRNSSIGGQLSLFAEDHVDIEISLDEPVNFSAIEMAIAEREVLGFSMLYSQFDEYYMVQCRYCNSNIASLLMDAESTGNMTLLAEIKSIDYHISQYGNKYAKIVFSDQTGEDRMYLFGKLYEKMISKCFVGRIYLLTVKKSDDTTKIDIVNFMLANEIPDVSETSKELHVTTISDNLPELRMYLKSYMMGDKTSVSVHLTDLNIKIPNAGKILIDNENLLEMSKKGFQIKLR
jgi:DNA polymerase III alpha subunit